MTDDSRILRVSSGFAGITRKSFVQLDGETLERSFCNSCGTPGGWLSSENVNRFTYRCPDCDERYGSPALLQVPDASVERQPSPRLRP